MSPSARLRFALLVFLSIVIIIGVLLTVVFVSRSMSRAGGTTVNVWLTTSDGSNQLTAQPGLTFISDSKSANSSTIDVNEHQQFQQMELWNIALKANHGPHNGGCPDCLGVVTVDPNTGNVIYSNDYYLIGHFSKFIVPGAYHIGAHTLGSLTDVAFKNPDGSKVKEKVV
jgi:O-glycosyl hydrolase